eukprot:CAMPEP_0174376748 /NCGR_PEP_ID=MMETSP0811_2-20130205/119335_1 /TAXON_ID=73025 ORGANISM="Eutreptiella gymnastica-like, Strain CCMP1594" /NCGR_SAMPLE_ID=MMETSP0811_2 /ASSEMBLY_ACC=CAM_ASM_000667 /LENGTH=79 /DNA_ID=CAMNT_0015528249 /DNA_START=499 /DNA_END=738 /DNA_ORIENTATION=-
MAQLRRASHAPARWWTVQQMRLREGSSRNASSDDILADSVAGDCDPVFSRRAHVSGHPPWLDIVDVTCGVVGTTRSPCS